MTEQISEQIMGAAQRLREIHSYRASEFAFLYYAVAHNDFGRYGLLADQLPIDAIGLVFDDQFVVPKSGGVTGTQAASHY